MTKPRAMVRNAASPQQVHEADRRVKDRRRRELEDLRAVLETEAGRRVFRRVLAWCGANQTVIRATAIEMAAAAGQQNVGHYLMAEIQAADDEALLVMQREGRAEQIRENRETDAVHTTSVKESDPDGDSSDRDE